MSLMILRRNQNRQVSSFRRLISTALNPSSVKEPSKLELEGLIGIKFGTDNIKSSTKQNRNTKIGNSNVNETVSKIFDNLQTEQFFKSLSIRASNPKVRYWDKTSKPQETDFIRAKESMLQLLEAEKFDSIIEILTRLSTNKDLMLNKLFRPHELSLFIDKVLEIHIRLNQARISLNKSIGRNNEFSDNFQYEISTGEKIRTIIHNLQETYSYELSLDNIENLLNFEILNLRLDTCCQLLEQLEADGVQLNSAIWNLKFKIFANGIPYLWVYENEYFTEKKKIKSLRKSKIQNALFPLMNKFYSENIPMTKDLLQTIIYCLGHNKETEYLERFIQENFKIDESGLIEGEQIIDKDSKLYPSSRILMAVVTSFSYSNEFHKALSYINSFQKVYPDIDLTNRSSLGFWFNLIKWANLSTEFNQRSVAQSMKMDKDLLLFENKVADLKKNRNSTMTSVWGLYLEWNKNFSESIYRLRIKQLMKNKQLTQLKPLLGDILKEYHIQSSESNSDRTAKVYDVFRTLMRGIIELQFSYGYVSNLTAFIEDWSIDSKMKEEMMSLYEWKKIKFEKKLALKTLRLQRNQASIDQEEKDDNLFGF